MPLRRRRQPSRLETPESRRKRFLAELKAVTHGNLPPLEEKLRLKDVRHPHKFVGVQHFGGKLLFLGSGGQIYVAQPDGSVKRLVTIEHVRHINMHGEWQFDKEFLENARAKALKLVKSPI